MDQEEAAVVREIDIEPGRCDAPGPRGPAMTHRSAVTARAGARRWPPRLGVVAAGAFAGAIALGLGALLPASPGVRPVAAAAQAVEITDGAFVPASLTINQGDVVTWTNTGTQRHTVTADDGSFDSGPLSSHDVYGNLFETPGTFTYHDALEPTIKGTVIVKAVKPTPTPKGTPAPTPPPGTLPPNFRTPPPLPTTSGIASETPGSPAPSGGAAGGTGGDSGGPGAATIALAVVILAAIASIGWLAIRGRR